jgi:uncharacterized protein DUF6791/ThiF family protein
MSEQLVNRSQDLRRLREEGYDVKIQSNYLLVRQVPYVTAQRTVKRGILVSEVTPRGDVADKPKDHVVFFVGEIPCDQHGQALERIINQQGTFPLGGDLIASCSFSSKPIDTGVYSDYYEKMTSYVNMLLGHARAIEPDATAQMFPPIPTEDDESVFRYLDAASGRAQISAVTEKLKLGKVAIVGLGGTGSYILDFIAKTPIEQIHLYDGDTFLTHNAFRAPGAASLEELNGAPTKVEYFRQKYDAMRRNIIAHPVHVTEANIEELRDMAFIFLAMDTGESKRYIIKKLEEYGVPFIDTGMGVYQVNTSLGGLVRTTTSVPGHRQHVWDRVSFADEADDEYERNIQLADLNALNALMAVIKWKKLYGVYTDFEQEYSSTYTIDGNHLLNEDQKEPTE